MKSENMKTRGRILRAALLSAFASISFAVSAAFAEPVVADGGAERRPASAPADKLRVHGIFRSHMVIQRDKPIKVWGWAKPDAKVAVQFGDAKAEATASSGAGRWEVSFPAQPANATGQKLAVTCGDETVAMEDVLVGDIWVMNGQSNMKFALKGVYDGEFEASMAHLPQLRSFRINAGAESEYVEQDLKDQFINDDDADKNWQVVTPEVALHMGAIGYIFGSSVQRSLQIPIGIIDNGRGGASLESLVPRHKFANDPVAAEYLKWVDGRRAAFSEEAFLAAEMEKWKQREEAYQKDIAADKAKGVEKKRKRPEKPDGSIRTWSVPGRSPSDAAACYNGMFGVFKGLNIKGVAFHQGFNNSMMNTSCNPAFYRRLMKLMVEGWREDFNDPNLPVAVIGLCAGGEAQTRLNFEVEGLSTASFIRESQRLGLADAGDHEHTVYIPSDDEKIPQLHTKKKKELGLRAARWALQTVYKSKATRWDKVELLSAVPTNSAMLLTFDQQLRPDDFSPVIEGFSIADKSGIFYMADAVTVETTNSALKFKQFFVSTPLVKEPVHVRYGWARAPMANLKVNGLPWQPLYSFRTDTGPFPPEVSHQDPDGEKKNSEAFKVMKAEAAAALKTRLEHEARK
jgi:sialate O-acetylesterase